MIAERPVINICVLCGSRVGSEPMFVEAARQLGKALAERNIGVVYAGSSHGMMGALAESILEAGGYVEGIIPEALFLKEKAHGNLSRRFVVRSMHERKELMVDRSNGLIVLPGGIGTIEIAFEVMSWAQMGIHAKPLAVWNVGGYFDEMISFTEKMSARGFVSDMRKFVTIHATLEATIEQITTWKPPTSIATWLDRDQI